MVSVLLFHLWQWLWFLGVHLDFLCCDHVGLHSLVGLASHHGIWAPNIPFCHIWNNSYHMLGSLLCQLGAVGCSLDSPWRVQMVCDHGCCGWCGLSTLCPGGLCPQVWSCGRLVLWHVGLQSGSLAMSASSLEGVSNGLAISFPRSFPSWQYAWTIWQFSSCLQCSSLIICISPSMS